MPDRDKPIHLPDRQIDVEILRSNMLTCTHAFSTRSGGFSRGIYEGLNLGRANLGDDPQCMAQNWQMFLKSLHIEGERFVHAEQVHGNTVLIAEPGHAHTILEQTGLKADGFVTDVPGLPLAVFTADCAPLLLQEPVHGIVGAVHCGWRSTMADIMGQALEKIERLGGDISQVRAVVGPCIQYECFQTGPEVPEAAKKLLGERAARTYWRPDPNEKDKYHVNLSGVIKRRLRQLGVPGAQIDTMEDMCTRCDAKRFWSHRRLGFRRGSQANLIML